MDWAINFIKDLSKRCFYGKITISFEAGKIVNVCKQSNHKPPR